MNYVWAERGSLLFHLSVTSKRPKRTKIRPEFLLKGLRSVGQKAKTGVNTRYKVCIGLKTDEHVANLGSLNASCPREPLIPCSRGLELLPPLFLHFRGGKIHGHWTYSNLKTKMKIFATVHVWRRTRFRLQLCHTFANPWADTYLHMDD